MFVAETGADVTPPTSPRGAGYLRRTYGLCTRPEDDIDRALVAKTPSSVQNDISNAVEVHVCNRVYGIPNT